MQLHCEIFQDLFEGACIVWQFRFLEVKSRLSSSNAPCLSKYILLEVEKYLRAIANFGNYVICEHKSLWLDVGADCCYESMEVLFWELPCKLIVQVMAVHSAVVKGAKQICDVSNKEMLELMEITDDIRKQIGELVMHTLACSSVLPAWCECSGTDLVYKE